MKDCAGKWGDEKKAKKVSGRKAYNEFMSRLPEGLSAPSPREKQNPAPRRGVFGLQLPLATEGVGEKLNRPIFRSRTCRLGRRCGT